MRDHRRRPAARAVGPVRQGAAQHQDPPRRRDPRGEARPRTPGKSRSCPRSRAPSSAMDPRDGAIKALVGGFDFGKNKFNHVTQAWRQPGSSFKPFIYSAALEKGFTPATVVNDGPLFFDAGTTGGQPWEPKNFGGSFDGPMPMRTALMKSKNLVTIRVLQSIGTHYAQDWITRLRLRHATSIRPTCRWRWARARSRRCRWPRAIRCSPTAATASTLPGDARDRPQGQGAGGQPSRRCSTRATARHPAAQRLHHGHACCRSVARTGTARQGARRRSSATDLYGKTGTTNDSLRHLVRGLPAHHGRRHLDRLRHAAPAWASAARPAAA